MPKECRSEARSRRHHPSLGWWCRHGVARFARDRHSGVPPHSTCSAMAATPGWAWDTLLFDGGTILVVITILLLARRGKLPGTRKAGGQSSGFPVTANT